MEENINVVNETRTIKLDIPQIIEDFYYCLENEEYEDCKYLKELFYREYDKFSEDVKRDAVIFIKRYLDRNTIDNEKDLNGLFDKLLEEDV